MGTEDAAARSQNSVSSLVTIVSSKIHEQFAADRQVAARHVRHGAIFHPPQIAIPSLGHPGGVCRDAILRADNSKIVRAQKIDRLPQPVLGRHAIRVQEGEKLAPGHGRAEVPESRNPDTASVQHGDGERTAETPRDLPGAIRRSIVHHNNFEMGRWRLLLLQRSQTPSDDAFLVQRRNNDGYYRRHLCCRRAIGPFANAAITRDPNTSVCNGLPCCFRYLTLLYNAVP